MVCYKEDIVKSLSSQTQQSCNNWQFITNIFSVKVRTWPIASFSRWKNTCLPPPPPHSLLHLMHFKTTTSLLSLCLWLLTMYFALSQHLLVSQHYLRWHDLPCHHRPSLSHFGPPPVTHLRWHLPAKVQLCHWFSSSVSPPTQSTSCPTPLCHQGLNLSLLMEPATVSLYKLPQICDLSYACWPLLLRKIGSVLSRSERNTRGSGLCKAVTSHCTSHSWAVCLV